MFGYIRPYKAELRLREFNRYRAFYCGLCKTLSVRYGQLPRLAVTYDMTFFVLLLQSLSDTPATIREETCILHPFRKRAMAEPDQILRYGADLTLLLTWYNFMDNLTDREKVVTSRLATGALRSAYRKAQTYRPAADVRLRAGLQELSRAEQAEDGEAMISAFRKLLGDLFADGFPDYPSESPYLAAFRLTGALLGEWIYILDAADDYERDRKRGRSNPLKGMRDVRRTTESRLTNLEAELDRTCALLPYRQDAELVSNIIQLGLPDVRRRVLAGEPLQKI
jgi:hypothetical protein